MKKIASLGLISLSLALSGCASRPPVLWQSTPGVKSVENEFFRADIHPQECDQLGCKAFQLTVTNKTKKNIEVDWNKTKYVKNGQTNGGLMFAGILYSERNALKSPDIVFTDDSLSKEVFPNSLVQYSTISGLGWHHYRMQEGQHGIYLTITMEGKDITEKLLLNLSSNRQ